MDSPNGQHEPCCAYHGPVKARHYSPREVKRHDRAASSGRRNTIMGLWGGVHMWRCEVETVIDRFNVRLARRPSIPDDGNPAVVRPKPYVVKRMLFCVSFGFRFLFFYIVFHPELTGAPVTTGLLRLASQPTLCFLPCSGDETPDREQAR